MPGDAVNAADVGRDGPAGPRATETPLKQPKSRYKGHQQAGVTTTAAGSGKANPGRGTRDGACREDQGDAVPCSGRVAAFSSPTAEASPSKEGVQTSTNSSLLHKTSSREAGYMTTSLLVGSLVRVARAVELAPLPDTMAASLRLAKKRPAARDPIQAGSPPLTDVVASIFEQGQSP